MLSHQFAYSETPIRKMKVVQFGILSPEEIVRVSSHPTPIRALLQTSSSVATIEHPELYVEGTRNAKAGSLLDPRMGTIDSHFPCLTCGEGISECPGHFGHIELARPVFHPGLPTAFILVSN